MKNGMQKYGVILSINFANEKYIKIDRKQLVKFFSIDILTLYFTLYIYKDILVKLDMKII